MKTLAAALSLFVATTAANATVISAELGPSRVVVEGPHYVAAQTTPIGLDGVPLAGQNISFDIAFINGHFIRAFTRTTNLFIDLRIPLNSVVPYSEDFAGQFPAGSGYFLDQNGNPIGPASGLSLYFDALNFFLSDIQLVSSLAPNTPRPLDIYGFHFDFAVPSVPGAEFVEDQMSFPSVVIFSGREFGIGPDIPRDIVPESGDTLALLSIGVVGLLVGKQVRRACLNALG
jgi:hypothetical protein